MQAVPPQNPHNGDSRLAEAMRFYRAVLQTPLQPPGQHGVVAAGSHLQQCLPHLQQPQQQQQQSASFGSLAPHPRQRPHAQQQQQQQQMLSASIPAHQQWSHQQQQQHGLAGIGHLPQATGRVPAKQHPWVPSSAQQHSSHHHHDQQQQQEFQTQVLVQQQQQQQSAHQSKPGTFQPFSPTGSRASAENAGTPAYADAQLQPTPTPSSWQQFQQQYQHQHRQPAEHKQASLHQHQRQQQSLQDVSHLLQTDQRDAAALSHTPQQLAHNNAPDQTHHPHHHHQQQQGPLVQLHQQAWQAAAAAQAPEGTGDRGWQHQQQRQQHQQQHQREQGLSDSTSHSLNQQMHSSLPQHSCQEQSRLQQQAQPQQAGAGTSPLPAGRQKQQQQSIPSVQQQQLQRRRDPHRPRSNLLLQRLNSWGAAADGEDAEPMAAGAAAAQGWGRIQRSAPAAAAGSSKSTTRWPWLGQDRRDAEGRQPGTPGYDPSTLFIPPAALAEMSDFGRQFWGIKCRAMDLVLFVRHGSFYNLFDVDADVGLRVGLNLSGAPTPNMWKVGCHINQFAVWAAKVLAQGYSVGRVEEMPQAEGGSSSNKLLVRQLVRIYTPGTAVEGLLLDDQDDMPHPLMCLVEIPYSSALPSTHTAASSRGFCSAASTTTKPSQHAAAVGICVLDISSGVCRAGAFSTADDPARSALAVALLMADPSEAVAVRNSLTAATVTLLKQHFEIKAAAGPGFSGSSGSDGGGDRARGQVPGVSWLPASAAGNVISDPTRAVLQWCLNEEQLQALQQIAAQAAAAVSNASSSASGSGSLAAADAAAAAVLDAVGVGVKQLERCSLLSDVVPTLEVQPLEALTARGGGLQPGRPLLLDINAIIALDLLPLAHISSSSSGGGGGSAALAATAAAMKGGAAAGSSLFDLLDGTVSAAGRRKLRQWICRPLTIASAINERLDVLDLFLQLPAAAAGLQQRLVGLPDADRLLPKAAAAVRALLQQQQAAADALGGVVDPMGGAAMQRERAWKALAALPACLMGLIQAVAALRSEVAAHTNTAKLLLLRRAELAAAKAVAPARAVHRVLSNASWVGSSSSNSVSAAVGRGKGKKGNAAAAAAAAAATGEDAAGGSNGSSSGIRLAPGASEQYDAAVAEQQHLQDSYAAELQAQMQWYGSFGSSGSSSGGGWVRQQQQQIAGGGVRVQEAFVVNEAEGLIGLVVQLSAATSHAGFWGQPGSSSRGTAANYGFSALLADMLAPGHTIVLQERLQDGQQQQQGTGRPPAGRGAGKAARGGRGGGGRGRQGGSAPTAAAGTGGDGQPAVLLHVHLPELQEMQQDVRAAEEQVVAAAAAALDGVAGTFLGSYGVFRSLVAAVADLDVLAGLAQVVSPGAAPPGCSFCRPQFAAAAASSSSSHQGTAAPAPLLQLDGLWHPLLGSSSGGGCVVPNDVVLGGNRPGAMLLTGANMGGKSTLLRSTCVAVTMAQLGCYVAASRAVLEPVDAIFTRVGAADAIMCNKSTFMVEMSETAACLAAATPASLLILDELGRGTASHDGYALAYGVLRYLACPGAADADADASQHPRAALTRQLQDSPVRQTQQLPRVLFATHYHMLTQEAELQDCTQSCHMATRWDADMQQLVHCYKLQPGAAPTGSCGIEVAALAGLPDAVVQRAASVAAVMQQHCEAGDRRGGVQGGLIQKLQGQLAGQ